MFEKVLPKNAQESLAALGNSKILQDAYMAGGTALALQIGHRFSYDFDFFMPKEFNADIVIQRIKKTIPDFYLERIDWGTILGKINETRFSLFFYDYPLLFNPCVFLKINIADVKDISAMKIAAISDRGSKKDFVDLYFIIKIKKLLTLKEALELYDKKFASLVQNKIHILKSLQYFDDAEKEGGLNMIENVDLKEVKKFFKNEVKELSSQLWQK